MANSWQPHAKPRLPCQWLEEALVESFSLRGLGRLAKSWKRDRRSPVITHSAMLSPTTAATLSSATPNSQTSRD